METKNDDIKNWLESGNFISDSDTGKKAVIIGLPQLVEGKYGQKLNILLELTDISGKHEAKTVSFSKILARDIAKKLGEDFSKWLGARGKITTMKAFNPEKKALFDKPIFELE